MGKLTIKAIESLVKSGDAGKTNDGDGLYFQISKAGVSSWIFRYKQGGKGREMGLGPYPTVIHALYDRGFQADLGANSRQGGCNSATASRTWAPRELQQN